MPPVISHSPCPLVRTYITPWHPLKICLDVVKRLPLLHVGTAAAAGRKCRYSVGIEHLVAPARGEAAAATATPVFRLRACAVRLRHRDPSVLTAPLDPFVAVLVQCREIFPQLFIYHRHRVAFPHRRELEGQVAKCFRVELVLMGLQKGVSRAMMPGKPRQGGLAFRLPNCVNCFPQPSSLHKNGFACSCTILWARTLPR